MKLFESDSFRYFMAERGCMNSQYSHGSPCTDARYSSCPHCSLDLCLDHIIEHQSLLRSAYAEVVDRINEKKWNVNEHASLDQIGTHALADLDAWRARQLESMMAIYDATKARIESTCQQSVSNMIGNRHIMLGELSRIFDSTKNAKTIHPNDIALLEEKINELETVEADFENASRIGLVDIVNQIQLPRNA